MEVAYFFKINPFELTEEQRLILLNDIDYVLALEEQRLRTINTPLTPERTKALTYQITGSITKAEEAEAKQYHLQYMRSHND